MKTNFKEQLHDERPYWKVIVSLAFSLTGTILFLYLGYKFLIFFMPFVIGWCIATIASPVVNWLEKRLKIVKKLGSVLMVIGVLVVLCLLLYLAISKLVHEAASFVHDVPELYQDIAAGFEKIGGNLSGVFQMLPVEIQEGWNTMLSNLNDSIGEWISKISEPTVAAAGNIAMRIPSFLISAIITFVSAYFFIAEREEVIQWCKAVAPDSLSSRMTMVVENLKYAVGGYFKAQLKIMAVVYLILVVGFLILGIHFSFLLALLIAFLDFLPFFGTGTALIPWAVYQFLVGNYKMAVGLLILYGVSQLVRQLIQPKLVGDSMGMKPLLTLFLLYVGYKIGGVFGMIFAVPVGMIVINLYKAGAFDYILDDVKILAEGVLSLRK